MVNLRDNIWAVKVPEDVQVYIVPVNADRRQYELTCNDVSTYLPPGTWSIICTSKEATEEQAAGIVQVISNGKISGRPQYRRYDRDPVKDTPARCWTRDARHSLETLLLSKGCEGNWAVLEKK